MRKVQVLLTVILVVVLLAGCSSDWRPKRLRLPQKGPVDIFLGIIDQIEGIGRSLSRQFRSMRPGRY